jgi:hypothetical protein
LPDGNESGHDVTGDFCTGFAKYAHAKMKPVSIAMSLVVSLSLSAASAGQPDSRFYGVWVGVETYQIAPYVDHTWHAWGEAPVTMSAVIVIGDSVQTLVFGQGLLQGRVEISPSWGENTLKFRASSRTSLRTFGKLVLSADGDTLTETAVAHVPRAVIVRTCNISGTFHRQGKK